MAIVQVIRNADDTFTVTLSPQAQAVLKRWAADAGRTRAGQLADVITTALRRKAREYLAIDGPPMASKYAALPADQQAAVDAILATAVVPPAE